MQIILGNGVAPTLRDDFKACAHGNPQLKFLTSSLGNFKSGEGFGRVIEDPTEPLVVVQSTATIGRYSANDLAWQVATVIDNAGERGNQPIWLVAPFLGFGRQDRRKPGSGDSIGLKTFAKVMKALGVVGISTIELHSEGGVKILQDVFGPDNVFNLEPTDIFINTIRSDMPVESFVVGGPDAGANNRADAVARRLNAKKFLIEKEHIGVNDTEVKSFEGDVAGKSTLTIDDMGDTCGTIINSQKRLVDEGAIRRYVEIAHPIFSNGALLDVFSAKAKNGDPLVTKIYFADTIAVGQKVEDLKNEFGSEAVDARTGVIHTGDMVYNHVVRDLLSHPAMQPR